MINIKKYILAAFVLSKSLSVFSQDNIPVNGYQLVWSDEFNGTKLNTSKWGYRALGKRGDAFNIKSAAKLDGKGRLVIEASAVRDSVFTAIVHTEHLFDTKYGYFECRVLLPNTPGIWPAFWLQSYTNTEGGRPESNGLEIDIFEYFQHYTKDSVAHTLHWGGYGATHQVLGPYYSAIRKTPDGYHTFALEWTPDSYSVFVDGVRTYTTHSYISNVNQYIVLSLEADKRVAGPLRMASLPDRFIIDYVRVYKKK